MRNRICLSCGYIIKKNGSFDSKLCIDCETLMLGDEATHLEKTIE